MGLTIIHIWIVDNARSRVYYFNNFTSLSSADDVTTVFPSPRRNIIDIMFLATLDFGQTPEFIRYNFEPFNFLNLLATNGTAKYHPLLYPPLPLSLSPSPLSPLSPPPHAFIFDTNSYFGDVVTSQYTYDSQQPINYNNNTLVHLIEIRDPGLIGRVMYLFFPYLPSFFLILFIFNLILSNTLI
jgi:hypothetical protein